MAMIIRTYIGQFRAKPSADIVVNCQENADTWDMKKLPHKKMNGKSRIEINIFGRFDAAGAVVECTDGFALHAEGGQQAIYIKRHDAMFFYGKSLTQTDIDRFISSIKYDDVFLKKLCSNKNKYIGFP